MKLINFQNAMNASEITDKLGLQSLRQRAWVSRASFPNRAWTDIYSTSNQPVPPLATDFTRVSNGSATT